MGVGRICKKCIFKYVFFLLTVIPQTCRYKGAKFECGLSISCVLSGGRPMDLCSGGMIWACCVDRESHPNHVPDQGTLSNASKYPFQSNLIMYNIVKL